MMEHMINLLQTDIRHHLDSAISAAAAAAGGAAAPNALPPVPGGRFHSPDYNTGVSMALWSETQKLAARMTQIYRYMIEHDFGAAVFSLWDGDVVIGRG